MEAITQADHTLIARITAELATPDDRALLERGELARNLLVLFRADFLGTTHYSRESRRYEDPMCFNRDDSMSRQYFEHFQFVDPVSAIQRRRRTPSSTYSAMPRQALRRTEYYNDFLRRHEVEEGIDLYLYEGHQLLGDFRVWRGPGRRPLGTREALLLSALKPWLACAVGRKASSATAATSSCSGSAAVSQRPAGRDFGLSSKEQEVLRLIATGLSDKEIARTLEMSFWTVRTHLTHLLRKTRERNRVGLATLALRR